MVEFIGLLKVKVMKGTNLAIRDMLSSDPYVVLNLGHQVVVVSVLTYITIVHASNTLILCELHTAIYHLLIIYLNDGSSKCQILISCGGGRYLCFTAC